MVNTIYTRTYNAPDYNREEILRYAGIRREIPELNELIDNCLNEVDGKLSYMVCYRELQISRHDDFLDLGFMKTKSKSLMINLSECDSIVLFAATVGIEIDRLIARYSTFSPTKSLIFQAIGAERIESLCDTFNNEIKVLKESEGLCTQPRYSPGYGDFSLTAQKDIFSVLDCHRKIGLSLNDSLLMSPSKSVTALIGVSSKKANCSSKC